MRIEEFIRECEDVLFWINEEGVFLTSDEVEQDVEYKEVLRSRFDEFQKDLQKLEGRVTELNTVAGQLIEDDPTEKANISQRQQDVNEAWERLKNLSVLRQEKLFETHEIQRLNRFFKDANEIVSCMMEKDAILSSGDYGQDLPSVQAFQLQLDGVGKSLAEMEEKVETLNKEAEQLQGIHEDQTGQIISKQIEIVDTWEKLIIKRSERKVRLDESNNLHRFLADFGDLVSWVHDMKKNISVNDFAKDRTEALVERYIEYESEIDAKTDLFRRTVETGQQLVDAHHYAAEEIRDKLSTLGSEKSSLLQLWKEWKTLYEQCLEKIDGNLKGESQLHQLNSNMKANEPCQQEYKAQFMSKDQKKLPMATDGSNKNSKSKETYDGKRVMFADYTKPPDRRRDARDNLISKIPEKFSLSEWSNIIKVENIKLTPKCVITVRDLLSTRHISPQTRDTVWISDFSSSLLLTDKRGGKLNEVDYAGSSFGCHSISDAGELIFLNRKHDRIYKLKASYMYTKKRKLMKVPPNAVRSIYSSLFNGDILIGIGRPEEAKVIRYSKTGQEVHQIQYDNTGKSLYGNPIYITESNLTGDICVSDKNAVVVVDKDRNHRFSYTGHPDGSELWPLGITTDTEGHILVSDRKSNKVHMTDKDGHFISFLLTSEQGIRRPTAISLDIQNKLLWIGEDSNYKIRVYKYESKKKEDSDD